MKVLGLAGWSGSGKTTLLVGLLPILTGHGLRVSTIKHAHHSFDVDQPGKDSHAHRAAGAHEVMIASRHRFALMHELREAAEPTLDALVARMAPVDLLLVEGYRGHPHDKIEIHRPALGKPLLCTSDPHVVAVASDAPLAGVRVPVLPLGDAAAVAAFVVAHCALEPMPRAAARS